MSLSDEILLSRRMNCGARAFEFEGGTYTHQPLLVLLLETSTNAGQGRRLMSGTKHDDFDFSSLSLKDLIEARDLYHFQLMSKANVVGTAVRLYLIRDQEDWPQAPGEGVRPRHKLSYARTFANSQVRDYSWPCISCSFGNGSTRQISARRESPRRGRLSRSVCICLTAALFQSARSWRHRFAESWACGRANRLAKGHIWRWTAALC